MPCHSGQLGPLTSWKRAHCKCWRFDASHPASSVTSWEKRNQADTRMARGSTFEFCGRSSPSNGNGGFWTCDVLVHRGDAECFRRRTLSEPAHCRPHSNDENTMAAQIGSSSPNIAVDLLHRNVDSREVPSLQRSAIGLLICVGHALFSFSDYRRPSETSSMHYSIVLVVFAAMTAATPTAPKFKTSRTLRVCISPRRRPRAVTG